MLGPNKTLLANPRVLLIDDADSNYTKFRAAGGEAVLFPQLWNANAGHTESKLTYLRQELDQLTSL
jgi:hypothetical protein